MATVEVHRRRNRFALDHPQRLHRHRPRHAELHALLAGGLDHLERRDPYLPIATRADVAEREPHRAHKVTFRHVVAQEHAQTRPRTMWSSHSFCSAAVGSPTTRIAARILGQSDFRMCWCGYSFAANSRLSSVIASPRSLGSSSSA